MPQVIQNLFDETDHPELIAYPLTVLHLEDFQNSANHSKATQDFGDLETADGRAEFINKVASGIISATSEITVKQLEWVDRAPICGKATSDSVLIWPFNDEYVAYTVDGIIVEIGEGDVSHAWIKADRPTSGESCLKINITLDHLHFDFLTRKLQRDGVTAESFEDGLPMFKFDIMNFEFLDGGLFGYIEHTVFKPNEHVGHEVTISY